MSAKNQSYNYRIRLAILRGRDDIFHEVISERNQSYINDIAKLSREFAQDMRERRYDKARSTLMVLCASAQKKIMGLGNAN